MSDSVFTRIINGEIPAHRIYEDEKVIAILDIHPAKPGHTLVITKQQVDQYLDLDDETYAALWVAVKKVATRLKSVLQTDRVKIGVVGTDIPHVHVHLIPFNENDNTPRNTNRDQTEPDHQALAEMAVKIRFED